MMISWLGDRVVWCGGWRVEELKKSEVELGKFNIESHDWLQQCTACGDLVIVDCTS